MCSSPDRNLVPGAALLAALLAGCGSTTPSGYATVAVAVADLDGDGRLDVVGINQSYDGAVSRPGFVTVRLQGAPSSPPYLAPLRASICVDPIAVAVGDVNGDGRPDLAVACFTARGGDHEVDLLLQGAAQPGTFEAPIALSTGARRPLDVRIADLDGDGRADVVVAAQGGTSLLLFLQASDGAFGTPVEVDAGGTPQAVAVADLTGAGRPDLVAARSDGHLAVMLHGAGAGTFAAPADLAVGTDLVALTAVDLDGDGHPDLLAADFDQGGLWVVLQAATGGAVFQAPAFHDSLDVGTLALAVADLNGDGHLDVVTVNLGAPGVPGSLSAFLQSSGGDLGTPLRTAIADPTGLALADLDGSGRPEAVVADGQPLVLVQALDPPGSFQPAFFLLQ